MLSRPLVRGCRPCASGRFARLRWLSSALTHIDALSGSPMMVDISDKPASRRHAHAASLVRFPPHVFEKLMQSRASDGVLRSAKGSIVDTAIIAGTMAAKRTYELIPFCHMLPLDSCKITIDVDESEPNSLLVECRVSATWRTGVEMEALVGATHAALCVYDMTKALSLDIQIVHTRLVAKRGGKRDVSNATADSITV